MAFHLTERELDRARAAVEHHGYGVFFPHPPEWETVATHWELIRSYLTSEDLDLYQPQEPLRSYAPKSRINLRPVTLLHPYDLLIYTALTLIVRDDLEDSRDPISNRRVFSHRSSSTLTDALYLPTGPARDAYRGRQHTRATRTACKVVAVTDIADFFPRLYQHRLENIIKSAATTPRTTDVARVLVKKFLLNIARGDSYGIPIGPLASSILAEAILIDVDAALIDQRFDVVRWFDDYTFFCRSEQEAQRALFFLAKWLNENHGLSLSPAKTKILRRDSFLKGISRDYEQRIKDRSEELAEIVSSMGDYGDHVELSEDQKIEVEHLNLAGMLMEALTEEGGIDYEFAELILSKLASVRSVSTAQTIDLIDVVIRHIPDLYPIISSVATFFTSLSGLSKKANDKTARALLNPILNKSAPAPEFVAMWILHIFASSPDWNHAEMLSRIYSDATSPVVKRYAALALATNGRRSHALTTREDLGGAKPMVRTAILRSWKRLGYDERKHWKQMDVIDDPLEKLI